MGYLNPASNNPALMNNNRARCNVAPSSKASDTFSHVNEVAGNSEIA